MSKRKRLTASFKARVAREALKEVQTSSQLAAKFGVHPGQISQWKKHVLDNLTSIFSQKIKSDSKKEDELIEELYGQIGKLKVELDWLKKKWEHFR